VGSIKQRGQPPFQKVSVFFSRMFNLSSSPDLGALAERCKKLPPKHAPSLPNG